MTPPEIVRMPPTTADRVPESERRQLRAATRYVVASVAGPGGLWATVTFCPASGFLSHGETRAEPGSHNRWSGHVRRRPSSELQLKQERDHQLWAAASRPIRTHERCPTLAWSPTRRTRRAGTPRDWPRRALGHPGIRHGLIPQTLLDQRRWGAGKFGRVSRWDS
jgi:hypothetical protein